MATKKKAKKKATPLNLHAHVASAVQGAMTGLKLAGAGGGALPVPKVMAEGIPPGGRVDPKVYIAIVIEVS